jgi:squamous cell carcinoma antigen recognized by T-cells 3
MKNLDWPEAIWEAWLSFEHLYGSVHEVDECLDKIEKAQYQVNTRRTKVRSSSVVIY